MGILHGDKFSPILFVGLGGAGSRVVDLLAGKLKRHPHWHKLQDLTHFVVIDTNKDDLNKNHNVPADGRFLISAFDRRAYVHRKRGLAELPEDPRITSWVHQDYQFREARGAGAGQIRVESRLGLHYNLENDRAGIQRKLTQLLDRATRRDNPWRDNEDRVVQVLVYASVAGGTGSGGFIPLAYTLRDLIQDQGWGRPELAATLLLPSTFLEKVERQLHDDIRANGYAALKELEFLSKLGYPGHPDRVPFVWSPDDLSRKEISTRPYSLVYLVDKPAELSIERYEHAIADASFLQIFSPLLGAQAGEYDNYDKHQRSLALGHFSVHWGTFGTAILQLPRHDLLRYASMRFSARAIRDWLVAGGEHPDFRVPWGDPKFERLDQREKDRIADDRFTAWVAWRAGLEEQADERGIFSAIHGQRGAQDRPWADAFQAKLGAIFDQVDGLIDLAPVNPGDITTGNPSLTRQLDGLRRDLAGSRSRVMGELLQATLTDLKSDRLFSAFFKEEALNPLAQRLFLIRQIRRDFIGPSGDAGEDAWLREEGQVTDLDSEAVTQEVKEATERLQRTSEPGFFGRIMDRENKDFARAKRRALQLMDRLAQDQRDHLKRSFWSAFEAALRLSIEARLASFRKVAELADEAARIAEDAAERFRHDPSTLEDSDVAQYYLDTEVLRDDHRRDRLWNTAYAHLLSNPSLVEERRVFDVITAAFTPAPDGEGRLQSRDASGVVRFVRETLARVSQERYATALEDQGLDLAKALELEARYIALRADGADPEALRQAGKLAEAVDAVSPARVRAHLLDKLRRLTDECVVLAHLDHTRMDDPTVVPAHIFYAGIAPRYATGEDGSLGELLREVAAGVDAVEGWDEPDMIVLYRAMLGVPSYFFKRINHELHQSYRRVSADPNRSYPLHIDRQFEGDLIPDLDPLELRRAAERASAEAEALAARDARAGRVRSFALAALAGLAVQTEAGWVWEHRGFQRPLGGSASEAFEAWWQLDPTLRGDLEQSAERWWREQVVDPPSKRGLGEKITARLEQLATRYAEAVALERAAERAYLDEERAAVRTLLAGLE
ncbi:MAG: hypothetical protein JXX28_01535 [Deltaproteobacteria bacterium]|nr:hypothetical protein [Deltaproteobacteria bacterium]